MSENLLKSTSERMKKSIEHTRDEMLHIRSGKASPAMLDNVKVDYYGNPTPLKQIANVAAPEPRLLTVQPYDATSLGNIEKAILSSDLGLNPQNDGRIIRIPIPILTSERREELIKVLKRSGEDGRVAIRQIRRDLNDQVKKSEKAKEISEDESHGLLDKVQKETDKFIAEIETMLKKREVEIREE